MVRDEGIARESCFVMVGGEWDGCEFINPPYTVWFVGGPWDDKFVMVEKSWALYDASVMGEFGPELHRYIPSTETDEWLWAGRVS